MADLHEYETSVTWGGGRRGTSTVPGLGDLVTAAPPEFGGEAGLWTPEHLFVAAANVCLMTTYLAIAELSKLEVRGFSSTARGRLEKVEGSGWIFTAIEIEAQVLVPSEAEVAKGERLLEKAERNCLVSKSMRCAVAVHGTVRAA